jgi:hypothetical protein
MGNVLAILETGLSFFLGKSGTATLHIGGKTQTVTVTETGAATGKLGSLTLASGIALAEQVFEVAAGQPGTFQVRVGADEYSIVVTDV